MDIEDGEKPEMEICRQRAGGNDSSLQHSMMVHGAIKVPNPRCAFTNIAYELMHLHTPIRIGWARAWAGTRQENRKNHVLGQIRDWILNHDPLES